MFITASLFAGGLVTNPNQSAAWVRLPARNASIGVDAAYFNPAGLMKLENGFHVSISNQSIWQTREVDNSYAGPGGAFGLNEHIYNGTATAPLYPSIYAVYKTDKLAFSIGFNPIGGGGGALYEKGLPSFEMSPSDLVPLLAASQGASAYRLDAYFEGSSVFLGYQGGISYKINDWLSVAAGLRYVSAKNNYEGHLSDIEVQLPSGWTRADFIMTGIANLAKGGGDNLTPLVPSLGGLTPAQAAGAGYISTDQADAIVGGLTSLGVPGASSLTISQCQVAYYGAEAEYSATATLLGDQEADITQSGSGITPIISVNISPSENLNIGIRYEMATNLELKNKTAKDLLIGYTATGTPITMFPNGEMTRNDMPAMLTVGIDYKLSSSLKVSLGSDYFFDKAADYGHKVDDDMNSSTPAVPISNSDIIDNNGLSFQFGLEYNVSDKFLVSGGYVWANKGVNSKYQSDLTQGQSTNTFGAGGCYSFTDNILLNFGGGFTVYKEDKKTVDHIFSGDGSNITAQESYMKNVFLIGIGLDFRF